MKKKFGLILVFFFMFSCQDVLALGENYNYEVTSLSKNDQGEVSILGFASLGDNRNFEVKEEVSVNNFSSNSNYQYSLKAVPVTKSGYYNIYATGVLLGNLDSGLDTYLIKQDSYYEKVGFAFTFSETKLATKDFSNGYVLILTVTKSGKKVSFPLSAYKKVISDTFGSSYKYTNGTKIIDTFQVQVVQGNSYYQKCSNSLCGFKDFNKFSLGKVYDVLDSVVNKSSGNYSNLTYYEVMDNVWLPISWVLPVKSAIILPSPNSLREAKNCSFNSNSQQVKNKTILACSGSETFDTSTYENCQVDEYSYYTKRCLETNYNANLKVNDINSNANNFIISNGAGFKVDANISTDYSCEYTFLYSKFVNDYQEVLDKLNYYEKESRDWYFNYNLKVNLDKILENYLKETSNLNEWNSLYDIKKTKATLKVTYDSKKTNLEDLVYTDDSIEHFDKNKKKIIANESGDFCTVNSSSNFNLNGSNLKINTSVSCFESWKLGLSLKEVCLNMENGQVESCNNRNNELQGGRKFYIDMQSASGILELELKNLGYDGKWNLNLKNCSFNVPNLLNEKITYREIDLNDPFLESTIEKKEVGYNFLNSKFDFRNIIKSDLWNNNYMYLYYLNKKNISNIRNDNKDNSSFLGKDCYFNENAKYICDFSRNITTTDSNSTKWFMDFDINE